MLFQTNITTIIIITLHYILYFGYNFIQVIFHEEKQLINSLLFSRMGDHG